MKLLLAYTFGLMFGRVDIDKVDLSAQSTLLYYATGLVLLYMVLNLWNNFKSSKNEETTNNKPISRRGSERLRLCYKKLVTRNGRKEQGGTEKVLEKTKGRTTAHL